MNERRGGGTGVQFRRTTDDRRIGDWDWEAVKQAKVERQCKCSEGSGQSKHSRGGKKNSVQEKGWMDASAVRRGCCRYRVRVGYRNM